MLIGKVEAIAAARAYADGKGYPAWREGSVRALQVVIQGNNYWQVIADDVLNSGDTWMDEEIDAGQSYLVDLTGKCIGVGVLNGYRLFPH